MRDVSYLFAETPLEQYDLRLLHPDSIGEYEGSYTPERIQAWNFGYYPDDSEYVKMMFLHEMSHIIDLWLRNKQDHLLQADFGYPFGDMTTGGLKFEMRAFSIQERLASNVFNHDAKVTSFDIVSGFKGLSALGVNEGNWKAMMSKELDKASRISTETYFEAWQHATSYIAAYR